MEKNWPTARVGVRLWKRKWLGRMLRRNYASNAQQSSTVSTTKMQRKRATQKYVKKRSGARNVDDIRYSWRNIEAASQQRTGWRQVICGCCSTDSSKAWLWLHATTNESYKHHLIKPIKFGLIRYKVLSLSQNCCFSINYIYAYKWIKMQYHYTVMTVTVIISAIDIL